MVSSSTTGRTEGQESNISKISAMFPTTFSAVIFVAYMALFVNQGILVTSTKDENNEYHYNTTTVVLFTECLKLVLAICLYLRENTFSSMFTEILNNKRVFVLYFVPAGLYCLYNNLQFVNLAVYDPTTYYLLLQFRVVVTGIIFQFLFNRVLSSKQWFSLLLLTLGCVIKHLKQDVTMKDLVSFGGESVSFNIGKNILLMLVQIFCSCFAGVYNEYLLKGKEGSVSIWVQNIFMYCDSIVCNLFMLSCIGGISRAFSASSLQSIFQVKVIAIILNYAAIGIVTSLFLMNLNSILKTFASALELMFTAVLCWIIFDIQIDIFTIVAIGVVSYAVYMYSTNPVINTSCVQEKKLKRKQSELDTNFRDDFNSEENEDII
ncbi:UDP-galactose transporter senju-like [Saccoglossus kowalevskii]|uniref:UDP-galactose translocator 1-like n=1 Tax=Saccoglossus kowalevskii TaxID=10224 RepID=A0ABM0GWA7_SACKO|nr:PREDICTED: UDP-galactose translocator 1-like [Saccoglossus kowalevskii]